MKKCDTTGHEGARGSQTVQSGLHVEESVPEGAYGPEEFEDNYPDGIERHFWNSARNDIILAHLQAAGAASGTILDIGCGRGITLGYLRERGYSCIGVEAGQPRLAAALEPFVHTGASVFDLPQPLRDEVGTILLLDVIEHIEDPRVFLRRCRESFSSLRTLLVTVPARAELWSNYDVRFGHYRRYNRAMLRAELEEGGFRPLKIGYIFHSLYPVLLYLSRVRQQRTARLKAPSRLWMHGLLRRFFYWDGCCLPGAVWGSSLIGVAGVQCADHGPGFTSSN